MSNISLLDCTLRDGGYVNNWIFGRDNTLGVLKGLDNSGVDIIEIGFLRDDDYDSDRVVFSSVKYTDELISGLSGKAQLALMAETSNKMDTDKLEDASKTGIDLVRIIVWKTKHDEFGNEVDALKEGFDYCKKFVEKGYKICIQPARTEQYSDDEFIQMLDLFKPLNPYAMYVVDSWGTMYFEEVFHYISLADKHLPSETKIGFHGHNNKMQAFSTAQRLVNEDIKHDLIIDASVYGIGRGAGNLNSELIADYLNKYKGKSYEVDALLLIYDNYIKQVFEKEKWGYTLGYYMSSNYRINPMYGQMFNDNNIEYKRMKKIIDGLDDIDRIIFSKQRCFEDNCYK